MSYRTGISEITPSLLFIIGFLITLLLFAVTDVFFSSSSFDIHLHDTYYIIGGSQLVLAFAIILGIYAALYHWLPKVFGRYLNDTMGYIHFWVTYGGMCLVLSLIFYQGQNSRYVDYSNLETFKRFSQVNNIVAGVALLIVALQVIFIFNCFYSLFKRVRFS